jgi:hypothetical protein
MTGRFPLLTIVAALAISTALAATTYKWVDERGHVHYADSPPEGVAYEIIRTTPRQPAALPVVEGVEPPAPQATPATVPAPTERPDDPRCAPTLYQIKLLQDYGRVYKPGAGGTRVYLDDAARPAEIERLVRARDEICSQHAGIREAQERRAAELLQALSPRCAAAREKLLNLEDPDSHSVRADVERQRAFVTQNCPEVSIEDVWLGDWIWIGSRRPPGP